MFSSFLHSLAVTAPFLLRLVNGIPFSTTETPQTQPARRDAAINFSGCTPGEIGMLNDHLDDMQTMAATAANSAKAGNKYFDGIFGKDTDSGHHVTDYHIQTRYQTISQAKSQPWHAAQAPTLRCDSQNAPRPSCNNGFGAPAMTSGSGGQYPTIWICASYWNSPKRIKDLSTPPHGVMRPLDEWLPHGGLLLHEFTHAWYSTADVKLREGSLKGTVAYNHEYCLRLLKEANGMTRTRNNAHTYAIFAAAVQFSKSDWSINPDRMSADRDLKRRG